MNCYGAKDFAAAFRTVRKNTILIAEEIGEEHYNFRPAPGSRSVAETLIHIAVVPQFAHYLHGTAHLSDLSKVNFMEIVAPRMALEKKPHTKAEILAMLQEEGDKFAGFLDTVTDELLAETVAMPPGMEPSHKTRFEMLLGPKEHEMHHRAQLMVMQRILGMTPHLTRQGEARMAAMQSAKAGS
jgi:uncharacterized damage-inducible protein DinB